MADSSTPTQGTEERDELAAELRRLGPKPSWVRFAKVRRSRRERRCEVCAYVIPVGSLYVRHALPPHVEPNSGNHWWVLSACGWTTSDCRRYWEVDARELRGEPSAIPA